MPLTAKGEVIKEAMQKEYGARGEQVFYASRNKGTISGVDSIKSYMDAVRRGDAQAMRDCFKRD